MPSYYDHYLIDNAHGIILGVEATPARFRQEMLAARRMLERVKGGWGICPESLGAEKAYGSGELPPSPPRPVPGAAGLRQKKTPALLFEP